MRDKGQKPLVSIICFCKNRASTIARAIESVLAQNYSNFEFVVQDGASTDGTLEILQTYAKNDSRIKLVSEPDSGPGEAFWKVLRRCQGEIIGTCLSDEELLAGALEFAVKVCQHDPHLGAITCDGEIADERGVVTGPFIAGNFDFVGYLFGRYCPFWSGSFFRRQALIDVGIFRSGWTLDCLEFEIWCRLATDREVKYVPRAIAKYGIHPGQLSNMPANFFDHLNARLTVIEKMFSSDGFFGEDESKKLECMINQVYLIHSHARAYKLTEAQEKLGRQLKSLSLRLSLFGPLIRGLSLKETIDVQDRLNRLWKIVSWPVPRHLSCVVPIGIKQKLRRFVFDIGMIALTGALPVEETQRTLDHLGYRWARIAHVVPESLRKRLPRGLKTKIRWFVDLLQLTIKYLPGYMIWYAQRLVRKRPREIITPAVFLYDDIARLYESRGQIVQALENWNRAQSLDDPVIDGLACQASLKLPSADDEKVYEIHKRWAERHAKSQHGSNSINFRPPSAGRKIRVGYHCSFMDSDTIRFMMGNVIAAHDRTRFEVIGYSPVPLSADLRSLFDAVKATATLKDVEFVDLVRKDQIDVLVEMSGFSPGHRFAAMASRCAPVQISYLNHTGTCGVPNVDFVLSDDICTPVNADTDRFYTERIYRLPGCFFCFDYEYEGFASPPVSDPPSVKRGFVTFGSFGSGGKINLQLIEWWADLLRRVPNSVFYLRNAQLTSINNRRFMANRFQRFGIGIDRLRIDDGTDRAGVLRSYADVDITLDTWPYCGGNTIAESLWQGVPVVTFKGSRFSSRYGASLVTAAGCPELVGDSVDKYLSIASELAQNPKRLLHYRKVLRQIYKDHGLGNSEQFSRKLENAYHDMLQQYWH